MVTLMARADLPSCLMMGPARYLSYRLTRANSSFRVPVHENLAEQSRFLMAKAADETRRRAKYFAQKDI
jgi:hypothetical protein